MGGYWRCDETIVMAAVAGWALRFFLRGKTSEETV